MAVSELLERSPLAGQAHQHFVFYEKCNDCMEITIEDFGFAPMPSLPRLSSIYSFSSYCGFVFSLAFPPKHILVYLMVKVFSFLLEMMNFMAFFKLHT